MVSQVLSCQFRARTRAALRSDTKGREPGEGAVSEFLFKAIVIGVGGTAAMDVWAIILNRVLGIPKPNWALAGTR